MGDCGGDLVGGFFLFGDAERERDLERRDDDLCFVRDLDPDRDLDRERERERLLENTVQGQSDSVFSNMLGTVTT